ncbi:MAG TPA: adenylate/guanylate cyclase domain-containing protein [Thermoanaerobaculia bacterium]|nr:adenylate/guanylate cyclase domain-containing protein [Thermoanaerobaculia bacterium]
MKFPAATETDKLTARAVRKKLFLLYFLGSITAVSLVLVLAALGLEFTSKQWIYILLACPFTVAVFVVPDFYLINSSFRRIGTALDELDRGVQPDPEVASQATIAALNLPFRAFIRVTVVHGPLAALAVALMLLIGNAPLFNYDFQPWQILTFSVLVLVFASPAHAIFEFFGVSKAIEPVLERLTRAGRQEGLQHLKGLKSTNIRDKLLYLAIFVSALPLGFFAVSVVFKVYRLLEVINATAEAAVMFSLIQWIVGVVAVCMFGALLLAILTAREVSRNAAKLVDAMRTVERGDLDVHLEVTGTDEYADLFRGFNLMTEGLREEVQILETSQALMGELNLDRLLQRIIRSTTNLLDADRTTLFMYDSKTDELWSRFAQGLNKTQEVPLLAVKGPGQLDRVEIRFPSTQGIAGAVFTSGQVENIADPQSDPRFNAEIDRKTGYRTESILAIPITTKYGERIGVTQVLNKRGGRFTPKDEARLRAFTAQIAVALENARLFEETLRMKNYNESILRSTSNGMITLDVERQIQTANDAALNVLKRRFDDVMGMNANELFAENEWVLHSLAKVEQSGQTDISVDSDLVVGEITASVNLTAVPLIDATKENIGSLLIIEDISSEKRLKSTMSRYMSKEVADQLLEGGEAVLGGKVQRVSILFSDIRSFTTVSESIGAKETVSMLNEYFEEMVDVIFRNQGILDKYIGDAIMALFGAPFNTVHDADHAVAAANEMMVTLRELNVRRVAAGKDPIDIGVGIGTGDVVVGNIGSPKRMEYTAIGDSVNLASRLEGATKMYGVKILVSEFTTRDIASSWRMREIDMMRVKGKLDAVAVCEALDHYDESSFPNLERTIEHYNRGLGFYRKRDWNAAVKAFQAALAANPKDKPSKIHLERCQHYVVNPPPVEWDGVWTLTEK